MSLADKLKAITDRETEFMVWAVNGEKVYYSELTQDDVKLAHRMAVQRMIHFNELPGPQGSYWHFIESDKTQPELARRRDFDEQRARQTMYVEGALF